MAEIVNTNSEILFIYEARLCNPNGDPDRENKPRIDPITRRNYVTDVRLKRFLRDYIIRRLGEKYIWVTTLGGLNVRQDRRLEDSMNVWNYKSPNEVTKYHIDARMFGATIPVGGEESKGRKGKRKEKGEEVTSEGEVAVERGAYQIVGPIQFAIGFSLHKVDLMLETSTISSRFVGAERESERQYGTFGKDWRIYYSLIAFYGVVNAKRSKETGLRELDVKLLDNLLWEAVVGESATRSKIGHNPHLYLRVEYNDGETFFGDLRRYVVSDYQAENVRDLDDIKISFKPLIDRIRDNQDRVKKAFIRESDDFSGRFRIRDELKGILTNRLFNLPHPDVQLREDIIVLRDP